MAMQESDGEQEVQALHLEDDLGLVKPHINFGISPVRDWFLSQLTHNPKEQDV